MFNINKRLGVRITPLSFSFDREDLDSDFCTTKRKILSKSLQKAPEKIESSSTPIFKGVTVPDKDSHLQYQQRLVEDVTRDFQLESLQLRHIEPALNPENVNNVFVSTKWRLNLGQVRSRKKSELPLDFVKTKDDLLTDFSTDLYKTKISVTDLITIGDRYPRQIDFASDDLPLRIESLDNTRTNVTTSKNKA